MSAVPMIQRRRRNLTYVGRNPEPKWDALFNLKHRGDYVFVRTDGSSKEALRMACIRRVGYQKFAIHRLKASEHALVERL